MDAGGNRSIGDHTFASTVNMTSDQDAFGATGAMPDQTHESSGSLRVKVLKATKLPNLDFGKPQNPFGKSLFDDNVESVQMNMLL